MVEVDFNEELKTITAAHTWVRLEFSHWKEYDEFLSPNAWLEKEAKFITWLRNFDGLGQFCFDYAYGHLYVNNEMDAQMILLRWS